MNRLPLWLVALALLLSAPALVTAQANREPLTDALLTLYNTGDISIIETQFAPDYIRHPAETGRDQLAVSVLSLRAALPDLTATVAVALEQADMVAVRLRLTGTFSSELVAPDSLPIPPNNGPVDVVVHLLFRLNEAGQVVEQWDGFDNLNFLAQMGAIPAASDQPPAPLLYPAVVDVGMSDVNRAVISMYFDAMNQGNTRFIDEFFKPDFTAHNPFGTLDRAGFASDVTALRAALPDLMFVPERFVTEGNWTAVLYRLTGTFNNPYLAPDGTEIPATNAAISLPVIVFFRFDADGQVAEAFEVYDSLDFLTQLGLIGLAAPGEGE